MSVAGILLDLLLSATPAAASHDKIEWCSGVTKAASVAYPGNLSISTYSDDEAKICSFSIDGATAGPTASGIDASRQFQNLTRDHSPGNSFVSDVVEPMLLAAIPKEGVRHVERIRAILAEEASRLLACARNFFAGKDEDVKFQRSAGSCASKPAQSRLLVVEVIPEGGVVVRLTLYHSKIP